MAELILTEEEKASDTYLDWDDAALGKLVRKTALMLRDTYGQEATFGMTGAHLLVGMAMSANSTETTIELNGLNVKGEDKGDWRIEVVRTKAP